MAEKRTDISTQSSQPVTRRHLGANPFRMLERFADEMDRMFGEFGVRSSAWPSSVAGGVTWSPQIDVSQKNNELVVRADLPGLTKDDVKVDITDDAITIQGERRKEHEEERGGVPDDLLVPVRGPDGLRPGPQTAGHRVHRVPWT